MATADAKVLLEKQHADKIKTINQMVGKATQAEFDAAVAELNKIEAEYRGLVEKECFRAHPDVVDILTTHHFQTLGNKRVSNDGVFAGFESIDKEIPIDLRAYCEYYNYPLDWYYEMQALNKRLTMKVAKSLGFTEKQLSEIDNSYAMDRLARDIELGKTPDSNTQVVKHMQRVFDLLAPEAGKVNNHDLSYVMSCYTKKGRKALTVQCSKHKALQFILLDVFYRIVTDGVYDADYRVKSVKKSKAGSSEKPAAKAKKAEKPAEVTAETPAA